MLSGISRHSFSSRRRISGVEIEAKARTSPLPKTISAVSGVNWVPRYQTSLPRGCLTFSSRRRRRMPWLFVSAFSKGSLPWIASFGVAALRDRANGLKPPFAEQNGPHLIELDSCICRKSLIISTASTRIRTGDLLITNQLHYRCAMLATTRENHGTIKSCGQGDPHRQWGTDGRGSRQPRVGGPARFAL
jgi:hypothetical protein